MRRFIAFLFVVCLTLLYSCQKNSSCSIPTPSVTASDYEIKSVEDSLEKYRIIGALQHKSGFFYVINDKGNGDAVKDLCSSVTVKYKGSFFNGVVFDEATVSPASFILGQTIQGFVDAVSLIKKGGSIDVYIPPSLGYGNRPKEDAQGNVIIPANSYLVFHIDLIDIK